MSGFPVAVGVHRGNYHAISKSFWFGELSISSKGVKEGVLKYSYRGLPCDVGLVEWTRTMDRWIRFLNLNRPLGDWGEPAPRVSLSPAVPLTPFCRRVHCRMSKGLTRERSHSATRHPGYESAMISSRFFITSKRN